jgi:hypothetical protein
MKSFYSIALVTVFAFIMALTAVVKTMILHQDLSPADAAVVALAIGVGILAYRLSQAEKRIAHLENKMECYKSKYEQKNAGNGNVDTDVSVDKKDYINR